MDQNGDHVIVDTDKNVIKANLVDYSDDIAFSELRQSLFINPLSGDAGLNSNIGGYDGSAGVGGIKVDRYQNFWKDRNSTSEAQEHMKFSIGFMLMVSLTADLSKWDRVTGIILIVFHRRMRRLRIWEFWSIMSRMVLLFSFLRREDVVIRIVVWSMLGRQVITIPLP